MKLARTLVLVALAALPAFAQDQPAGPGANGPGSEKGTPAQPAPDAKAPAANERQVDSKAMEVLELYGKKIDSPKRHGVKDLACRIELPMAQLGGDVLILKPHWKESGEYECDIELPESLLAMIPPEQVDMMKKMLAGQFSQVTRRLLDEPIPQVEEYDVTLLEEAGKPVVVLTAFGAKAEAEKQKLYFGVDGLLTRMVATPKIDPNDPQAAMMAGVDVEISVEHEKRGDLFVVSSSTVTTPMGEMAMKTSYFAGGDKDTPLPKSIEIVSPMAQEPMTLTFSDYVIDGKKVDATSSSGAKAPAETPAGTPAEKPASTPGTDAPAAPQGPGESPAK